MEDASARLFSALVPARPLYPPCLLASLLDPARLCSVVVHLWKEGERNLGKKRERRGRKGDVYLWIGRREKGRKRRRAVVFFRHVINPCVSSQPIRAKYTDPSLSSQPISIEHTDSVFSSLPRAKRRALGKANAPSIFRLTRPICRDHYFAVSFFACFTVSNILS
jgi:hypothetical protein